MGFNSGFKGLTDSVQVTVVDNSVYSHDGSIGNRTTDSHTAWSIWSEETLRYTSTTSEVVFVYEHL